MKSASKLVGHVSQLQAETSGRAKKVQQERDFLKQLNDTLLANQREYKVQLAAAAEKLASTNAQKDAQIQELQEQVWCKPWQNTAVGFDSYKVQPCATASILTSDTSTVGTHTRAIQSGHTHAGGQIVISIFCCVSPGSRRHDVHRSARRGRRIWRRGPAGRRGAPAADPTPAG